MRARKSRRRRGEIRLRDKTTSVMQQCQPSQLTHQATFDKRLSRTHESRAEQTRGSLSEMKHTQLSAASHPLTHSLTHTVTVTTTGHTHTHTLSHKHTAHSTAETPHNAAQHTRSVADKSLSQSTTNKGSHHTRQVVPISPAHVNCLIQPFTSLTLILLIPLHPSSSHSTTPMTHVPLPAPPSQLSPLMSISCSRCHPSPLHLPPNSRLPCLALSRPPLPLCHLVTSSLYLLPLLSLV